MTSYGHCPKCGFEKALTEKRRLVASHVAGGTKCRGSGLPPIGEIRSVEPEAPAGGGLTPIEAPAGQASKNELAELPKQQSTSEGRPVTQHEEPWDFEWKTFAGLLFFCGVVWYLAWGMYKEDHPVVGTIFVMAGSVPLAAAFHDFQVSRKSPEKLREHRAALATVKDSASREKAKASERKAASLREKLGPPPPGLPPAAKNAVFLRLNEKKMTGLRGGPNVDLVCGRCGHGYRVPKTLVNEYRAELSPGASLRKLNNPDVAFRQQQAQLNLRCPLCGSIDPGVWITV